MCDDNRSLTNEGSHTEGNLTVPGPGVGSVGFVFEDAGRSFSQGDPPDTHSSPGVDRDVPPSPPGEDNPLPLPNLQPQPLEGVITLVQRTEEEPIVNWYRFFSKMILAIVFLPLLFTLGIVSLLLSISFAIIGFAALSSLFNPVTWMTALFELLEVVVLGRLRRSNQFTVYRGLVRDIGDRVFAFYLYGALRNGLLVEGHRVRLFGDWRCENRRDANERGTLFVSQGQDLTTGTTLSSAPNAWRPVFFILLSLFVVVVGMGIVKLPHLIDKAGLLFH